MNDFEVFKSRWRQIPGAISVTSSLVFLSVEGLTKSIQVLRCLVISLVSEPLLHRLVLCNTNEYANLQYCPLGHATTQTTLLASVHFIHCMLPEDKDRTIIQTALLEIHGTSCRDG